MGPRSNSPDTGNKSIYFGDFSRLVVRRVQSATRVERLGERWAEFGMIGFQAHVRASAVVAKTSGASGIKYLVHA
jgi:HK97 family phage major capsid protein